MPVTEEQVWEALRDCYDPEIPLNIVDLGLIYEVKVENEAVQVKMTLTAQGCPPPGDIADGARSRVQTIPGVKDAAVEIVWDPPWDPSRMSEEGKRRLGITAPFRLPQSPARQMPLPLPPRLTGLVGVDRGE